MGIKGATNIRAKMHAKVFWLSRYLENDITSFEPAPKCQIYSSSVTSSMKTGKDDILNFYGP